MSTKNNLKQEKSQHWKQFLTKIVLNLFLDLTQVIIHKRKEYRKHIQIKTLKMLTILINHQDLVLKCKMVNL